MLSKIIVFIHSSTTNDARLIATRESTETLRGLLTKVLGNATNVCWRGITSDVGAIQELLQVLLVLESLLEDKYSPVDRDDVADEYVREQ